MQSARCKTAGNQQAVTGGVMAQNEPGGVVGLTAPMEHIFGQPQRQTEFAAEDVVSRLSPEDVKEPWGRIETLPQLECAGVGTSRFRSAVAFEGLQHRCQIAAKFEL